MYTIICIWGISDFVNAIGYLNSLFHSLLCAISSRFQPSKNSNNLQCGGLDFTWTIHLAILGYHKILNIALLFDRCPCSTEWVWNVPRGIWIIDWFHIYSLFVFFITCVQSIEVQTPKIYHIMFTLFGSYKCAASYRDNDEAKTWSFQSKYHGDWCQGNNAIEVMSRYGKINTMIRQYWGQSTQTAVKQKI